MEKILLSWYAYNNDFIIQQSGNRKRKLGTVNEDGPSFNVHKHYWDGIGYSKHLILSSSVKEEDNKMFLLLINELKLAFNKHIIEYRNIPIEDPISVSEIFTKLNSLLAELSDKQIDIFISPGTPAMQTAWYLLGTNYKRNTSLFQLRGREYTKERSRPEKIMVSLDRSLLPMNVTVAEKLSDKPKTTKDILITESLAPIYKKAEQIAITYDISCLILGENGTGKENLARFIHEGSIRNHKPFIAVNCAVYTDELLRSELFGYEKGSFTGANDKKIGLFEAASGGTIFLDEIGDISTKMQLSLLRVLQEKKIQRIGAMKEMEIDVRVIAATNQELEELCEQNKFRWDLYFRLAVLTLKLPPLRTWGQRDLKMLINHFNKTIFQKFPDRLLELKISKPVIDYLLTYDYRGNIRELENMFVHFYTFCDNEIIMEDLPDRLKSKKSAGISLASVEKQHIITVYLNNKKNLLSTSRLLGIHRDTLKRKLIEYGMRLVNSDE